MKTTRKIIDVLAVLVIVWQVGNFIAPPTVAHAGSPYGAPVCFYPASARKLEPGVFSFATTDPTQTLYLSITGTKRGIVTRNDGGYNNLFLNKLFPSMTK